MWKKFKSFISSLVQLFSLKKGKNVYSDASEKIANSSAFNTNENEAEGSKSQDEHKINVLLKYTTNEADRNYIKENRNKFLMPHQKKNMKS